MLSPQGDLRPSDYKSGVSGSIASTPEYSPRIRRFILRGLCGRRLHEDHLGISERQEQAAEVSLSVLPGESQDAIVEGSLSDLILCHLANGGLQVHVAVGQQAGMSIVDVRLLVVEGGGEYFS
jgi:hypothetical protein